MNNYEQQYLALLKRVKETGVYSKNRTGINTYKVWGAQININLQEGFPLLTTKKMHIKSVVHELLWMIKGDTNIQYLLKNGVTFWTEWPYQVYRNTPIENLSENERGGFPPHWEHKTQKEFEQTIINDDEFAKKWGSIGEYGYGGMWRAFPFYNSQTETQSLYGHKLVAELGAVDQLTNAINELKNNPDSRRIIITAWHPYHSNRKEDALLPACHNYIQFGTEELTLEERRVLLHKKLNIDERPRTADTPLYRICDDFHIPKHRLNCYFNMRSSDTFLGLPFNCAFYALFTHLIANELTMIPGQLVYTAADVHLYENHLNQVDLQLVRDIRKLPKLNIKCSTKSIFEIKFEDVEILDYTPHPTIKADVAV